MEYHVIFFPKDYTNTSFYQELLKQQKNEKWLEEGLKSEFIDINHQDEDGNTFLINCLKEGKFQSVEWLIKHGADIFIKNKERKAAINIAVEKNSLPAVKGLLELEKIDINEKDIDGRTLLQNVVVFGNHQMAKLLINNGANVHNRDIHERNILYDALSFGDVHFITYLLEMKELERNYLDEYGNSLMQHPEVSKNSRIAKTLLSHGIDPTIIPKSGEPYLLKLILNPNEEMLDILNTALENKADVNTFLPNGNTIMSEVIITISSLHNKDKEKRKQLFEAAKIMLRYEGKIDVLDHMETGVFYVVKQRDIDLLSFLLEAEIDPNIQNDNGETILFDIIYDGVKSLNFIYLLIKYNIDPNIKNKDGKNVYELLNNILLHLHHTKYITDKNILLKINKKGEYLTILLELLKSDEKSDHNYFDSTGNPLFFNPLLYNHHDLFQLYIHHKFDINMKNYAKHTIFYEYILKVFEKGDESFKACKEFEENLSSLISFKADQNFQDALGWTVLHKIVHGKCNDTLFNILTKIVAFDYSIKDKMGRTVIHNAVWSNDGFVIKRIHSLESSIINIPDNYNILPITYAALLGNKQLVLLFLELGSNISAKKQIVNSAIKKFSPMLKNLSKLIDDIHHATDRTHIQTLIEQIEKDFQIRG
jgi:ankyrin repeat protein